MREYISGKLNAMKNLEEKESLRVVLEQVFLPLYDETMAKYTALEERVKNEFPPNSKEYTVYSTLLPKEKAEGFVSWLHPILEDTGDKFGDEEMILDTVFIEADYLICREITNSKEIFTGTLHVDNREVPVQVWLRHSKRYLSEIAKLYPHFINNEISWRTLNLPYIHKMFDVVLLDTNHEEVETLILKQDNIDWDISFGKHDKYVRKNMTPVWNISRFTAESDDFPTPVVEKKVYEYHFDLDEVGTEHGYLADYNSAPIVHTRREKKMYIVSAPDKKKLSWTMVQFSKPSFRETLTFPYPVLSNTQLDQFASRMIAQFGAKVNTKAELVRLISSFDIADYIKFESFRVLNNQEFRGESYESNFFIEDEIRDGNISKTLLLQFSKNNNKNVCLMRDVMSFIVSHIQLVYPEYNCIGALL